MTPTGITKIDEKLLDRIKFLILGGEKLHIKLFEKLEKKNCEIFNFYGLTETTIACTQNKNTNINNISIGKPLNNYKGYILNKDLKPIPIGAIGELHIGGAGLARGYLNKPELTKEKFIPNPFQTDEEKKKGKINFYLSCKSFFLHFINRR